jgi:HlyD family secretion protein
MRKRIVIIVVVVAAIFAGLAYSEGWFSRDSSLQGSGTVEARDIRVGSKVGGRIDQVLVREGDTVKAGQVLITFDDKELQAALDQSKAAAEKAARGYRPEEVAEAKAALAEAKAESRRRLQLRTGCKI